MGFFDFPAPDDDEETYGVDPDPPGRWLGGVVPVEAMIGRSERAAVAVRRIVAYQTGFELQLVAWIRRPPRSPRRWSPFHQILLTAHGPSAMRDDDGNLVDEFVRFGVRYPDGAKITNLQNPWALSPDATEPMHGMEPRSGSSSDGEADQDLWIWPLPEGGDLTLVCEWPAYGIPESELTLDGAVLRAAAARSVPVWPDESPPHSRAGSRPIVLDALGHSATGGRQAPPPDVVDND